jgi:DnaJ-class molecular chaperone
LKPKSRLRGGGELKMTYFKNCKSIEEAKALYRKLMLKNHPDWEKIMLKKSMLTYRTLDRFEEEFDISLLTDDEKRKIEHDAYCANMGAKSEEAAWDWFIHCVVDIDHIQLTAKNIYTENGYKNREDCSNNLANDYGVDLSVVTAISEMLGPNEDFDGLVTSLEDYSET